MVYDDVEEVRPGLYVNKNNRVVKPVVKNIHRSFCLKNIHWKNLLIGGNWSTLIIILCLLFAAYGYHSDTAECFELLEKPCEYASRVGCEDGFVPGEDVTAEYSKLVDDPEYNFSY